MRAIHVINAIIFISLGRRLHIKITSWSSILKTETKALKDGEHNFYFALHIFSILSFSDVLAVVVSQHITGYLRIWSSNHTNQQLIRCDILLTHPAIIAYNGTRTAVTPVPIKDVFIQNTVSPHTSIG